MNTQAPNGDAAIELRNIAKVFPAGRAEHEVAAVNGVSLIIRTGEFFTLLGPSGCGKTTTLRMIAGFDRLERPAVAVPPTVPMAIEWSPPRKMGISAVGAQALAIL